MGSPRPAARPRRRTSTSRSARTAARATRPPACASASRATATITATRRTCSPRKQYAPWRQSPTARAVVSVFLREIYARETRGPFPHTLLQHYCSLLAHEVCFVLFSAILWQEIKIKYPSIVKKKKKKKKKPPEKKKKKKKKKKK